MNRVKEKASLRKQALARRKAMGAVERASLSLAIEERLEMLPAARRARTIMAFASFRSEVDMWPAIRRWLIEGRRVCLPRTERETGALRPLEVRRFETDLETGTLGILEPIDRPQARVVPEEIDLCVVPGLLFDRRGHRLGYGAGYYDRFLDSLTDRTTTVAVAFGWQVVPVVPDAWHDRPVRWIATDSELIRGEG